MSVATSNLMILLLFTGPIQKLRLHPLLLLLEQWMEVTRKWYGSRVMVNETEPLELIEVSSEPLTCKSKSNEISTSLVPCFSYSFNL